MKSFSLLTLSLFITAIVYSQTLVEVGNSMHEQGPGGIKIMSHCDETGIYVNCLGLNFLTGSPHYSLERYQNSGEFNFVESIDMPKTNNKEHSFLLIAPTNNGNYVLSTIARPGSHKLFCSKLEDGVLVSEPKLLKEVKYKVILEPGDFVVSFHEKSQKLIVAYRKPLPLKPSNIFEFSIFDNEMNLVIEDQMELPFKSRNILFTDRYFLDADGNLIMPLEIENIKKEKGQQSESFILFVFDITKKKMSEYRIELKDKIILPNRYTDQNYIVKLTDNGSIKVVGLFADHKNRQATGVFNFELNINGGNLEKTIYEFDKETLTKLIGEKAVLKGQGIEKYKINEIINKKDGGYFVVAENNYNYSVGNSNYGSVKNVRVRNNIVVFSINPNDDLDWIRIVPRKSKNEDSYILNYNSEEMILNFAYTDLAENLEKLKYHEDITELNTKNGNKAMLVHATIDKNGELIREPVKTSYTSLVSSLGFYISDTEFVFQSFLNGGKFKFGKIQFNNE